MSEVTDDLVLGDIAATEVNADNGGAPAGLPMPRNADLLTDVAGRPRVTHFKGRRYPFPIPNGWFVVAESADLAAGEVRPLYYFGRDLVLYRTTAGEARVMDAHCMHLGAHLAVGGRVEGDCIRCPFHGWKFNGADGTCVEIPYGDVTRIPTKAHSRSYPTIERNHMVWAWYHGEGGEPFYDVPDVTEFDDPAWLPIVVRSFEIRISAQDMAENNVDFAHFRFVHGTEAIPEDEFFVDGTYKKAVGGAGTFVREGFGLGLGVLRITDYVTFISSTTPIDEDNVHVRWVFTAPKHKGDQAAIEAAESFCAGVSQDIPIWENKIYRDPPVITKTEKLILEHRRWCEQFYSGLG
ncbi:MAG: (2Fe-2S)-binding protein [Acidimicrobiales bacterium]|nr:(2Fe-2S)-binding protein [Acidimicrobiales bacterium]